MDLSNQKIWSISLIGLLRNQLDGHTHLRVGFRVSGWRLRINL